MATSTQTFTFDGIIIPTPFIYQTFEGLSGDSLQRLEFAKQCKEIRFKIENNSLTFKGSYGNQASYSGGFMFENEVELPAGTDWTMETAFRAIQIKSTNSGNPATYTIEVWFLPAKS